MGPAKPQSGRGSKDPPLPPVTYRVKDFEEEKNVGIIGSHGSVIFLDVTFCGGPFFEFFFNQKLLNNNIEKVMSFKTMFSMQKLAL